MPLSPHSIVINTAIESSSGDGRAVFAQQVKDTAGVGILTKISAGGAPASALEDSIFLSNSGDDSDDGLSPARPVKTWAKAYNLAIGGSDVKAIQIPDKSVFTVTHYSSPLIVHGFNGARLIGDFEPKGEWYVTYLGDDTTATKNTLTLGEGLKIVCSEIHANVQDLNANYSSLTYTIANEIDGDITLRGTGFLHFFVPIVTGKITINDSTRVYGLLLGKPYGADFSHLMGHFLGLTAQEGTFDTLTVKGDIINTALNSRLDQIARDRETALIEGTPAGESLSPRTALTVVDTDSGPRYYHAKDRVGDSSLLHRSIYDAAKIAAESSIDDSHLDKNFARTSSSNVKLYPKLDPGTYWGALVWGDNATSTVRARIIGKDPTLGYLDASLQNKDGDDFTEFSIDTSSQGDVEALAVAWGKRRDKDLWIFASLGTSKKLYALYCNVDDTGRIIVFGDWFKIAEVRHADSLSVVYHAAQDSFHTAQYSVDDNLFHIQNFFLEVLDENGTYRYQSHRRDSENITKPLGVPPSKVVSSIGTALHGEDLLVVVPTQNIGEVVLYRYSIDQDGRYANARTENSGFMLLNSADEVSGWGMASDGVELFFAGATDYSVGGAKHSTLLSFFVRDLVLERVSQVYDIMEGEQVNHCAVSINATPGDGKDSTVAVVAVDQSSHQKVYKTQFNLPTVTTTYKNPVGLCKTETMPGEIPLVATTGEKVGGFSTLMPGVAYFLHADGHISQHEVGGGVPIFRALTKTTVQVGTSVDAQSLAQATEGVRTTQEDIKALQDTQAELVAGEPLDVFRFVSVDKTGEGELFHARDTSGLPHDPSRMAIYTVTSTDIPDDYQDTDFAKHVYKPTLITAKDAFLSCNRTRAILAVIDSTRIYATIIETVDSETSLDDVIVDEDDAYRRDDFTRLVGSEDTYISVQTATPFATGSAAAGLQAALTGDYSAVIFNRSSGNGAIHAQSLTWDADSTTPLISNSEAPFNAYDSRLLFNRRHKRLFGMFSTDIGTDRHFYLRNFSLDPATDSFISFSDVVDSVSFQTIGGRRNSNTRYEFGIVALGDRLAAVYTYNSASSGSNTSSEIRARWIDIDAHGHFTVGDETALGDELVFDDLQYWSVVGLGHTLIFYGIRMKTAAPSKRGQVDCYFYRLNDDATFTKLDEVLNVFGDTGEGTVAFVRGDYNPLNHSLEIVQYIGNTKGNGVGTTGKVRKTQVKVGVTNHSFRPIAGYTSVDADVGDRVMLSTRGQVVHLPKGVVAQAGDDIFLNEDGTTDVNPGSPAATSFKAMEAVDSTYGILMYPLGAA